MPKKTKNKQIKIFTIGHSTHPIEKFIEILQVYGVEELVDIRTIPKSRHNPQFNKDIFPESLGKIKYLHIPELGGLRHAKADSLNIGWENASFRGFADYMLTEEFDKGIAELIDLAQNKQIAIMCSEAVPWRCHRSLIADALTVRGILVEHILSRTSVRPHSMTSFAKVEGIKVIYPGLNLK